MSKALDKLNHFYNHLHDDCHNYSFAKEVKDIIVSCEKELKEKEKQDFILKHLRKDIAIEYEIEKLEEEFDLLKKVLENGYSKTT